MTIERGKNEMIIRIPDNLQFEFLQDIIDYITVKSIIAKSQAKEEDIEDLSEEIKSKWWEKNKKKFIK